MKVNLRKLMQLMVFFAHHEAVKPLGKTKLFKLLYFTDVTHLRMVGQSITGAEYLKYPFGPVPMQGSFALKELRNASTHQSRAHPENHHALSVGIDRSAKARYDDVYCAGDTYYSLCYTAVW